MVCQVEFNQATGNPEAVRAKNGEDSLLYKSLLGRVPERYYDKYVQAALEEGIVRIEPRTGLVPKEQVALVLWNKWYTEPDIRQRVEEKAKARKTKVMYDVNGEPAYFEVEKELIQGGGVQKSLEKVGVKPVIKFLTDNKLVQWVGKKLFLSEELTHSVEGIYDERLSNEEVNRKRVEKILEWFGLPESMVSFKKGKEGVSVMLEKRPVQVGGLSPAARDDSQRTNTQTLIEFLRDRFPQLKMEYVSEREAKEKFTEREQKMDGNKRGKLDFDRVNSFTHQGTVYLIEGRVTDQVAAEEALHPFVYTIFKNNAPLFNSLLEAAKKDFPSLHKEIERTYSERVGFSQEDRNLELVTQALGRTFKKEYETQAPQSVRALLQQVLQWFAQLVKDFGAFIGADSKVRINVATLPEGATLTSLAQLLNTHDSQFLVDTTAPDFNFSLTPEREQLLKYLMGKCTSPLQVKILEDLFQKEAELYFDDDTHSYSTDEGQNIYTSTTTAIGGKFDDEAGLYERNRLFGNDFDMLMEGLAQGKTFKSLSGKIKALNMELAAQAYAQLQNYIYAITQEGAVVVPQMRLFDRESKIAGTMDLLLIKPDGSMTIIDLKVSKHSIKDDTYNVKHKTKEGSYLPNIALSTRDKHGIQVGVYQRLLNVMGYYPDQTMTYHIKVNLEKVNGQDEVKSFYAQGAVPHPESASKPYVNKIVKTQVGRNRVNQFLRELGQLSEEVDLEAEHDEALRKSAVFEQTLNQMRADMEEFREKARRRIDRMELVKTSTSFNSPANRMMHKLSQLVMIMGQDLSRGQTQQAYGAFLNHAKTELEELTKYMADPKNREEEGFIEKVLEASKYLETYRGMVNSSEWAMGNKTLENRLKELLLQLNSVQTKIRTSLENYVLDAMMKTTGRKEISKQEWEMLIKEGTDISNWDYYAGDIDSSTDPLIAVAAKLYKRSKMRADDRAKESDEKLYEWGARLKKFFGKKPDFSALYEVDENGKRTGRYVQQFGPQLDRMREALRAKLLGDDGKMKKYRKVYTDDEVINDEDTAFNRQLNEDMKEWRAFHQPEVQKADGVEDGNYYRYNDAFKRERAKYEVYRAIEDEDGNFIRGVWDRREVDDQGNEIPLEDYQTYKHKYFTFNGSFDKPYYENGVFTGQLLKGAGSNWSVKREFIEAREVAADGTDMRSQQWLRLQNPTNEGERIMSEFYEFFKGELEDRLKLLPLSSREEMMGRIPVVRGRFIDQIKKNGATFFKVMARNVRDWFSAHTITAPVMHDDEGGVMGQLPVFYTGSLRDTAALEKLKGELKQLEQDKKDKKITREKYYNEKDRLRNAIQAVENAMEAVDMETDLLRVLGEFNKKVFEYDEMHRIEASLLAVQEILDKRKYQKRTSRGSLLMERIRGKVSPVVIEGKNSNASKRFKAWMDMTFYNSPDIDKSMTDVYAKRFMNLTSLVNVGFNFFGAVHNYLMNRITMAIETWGGLYYDRQAGMDAVREYNQDYLPHAAKDFFRSLVNPSKWFTPDSYYEREPPNSKYEAMCRMMKIPRGGESTSGKPDVSALMAFGYKLASAAEFNTQSKVAVAFMRSKMVEGPRGEKSSFYDAYEWKPGEHMPRLKQGFNISPEMRHDTTNQIWEINKRMFGNYATEDRMLIERHTLGIMAAQFHKWVYPLARVRLHREYVDENLGWQEGRLRSAMEFLGFLKRAEGDWKEQWRGGLDKLNEVRAKNMYRNAAEVVFLMFSGTMYMILQGIAAGLDDDDDRMKRLVNFLRYENTRQTQEVRFWIPGLNIVDVHELIKNPFAVAGSFKQYADVFKETLNLGIAPFSDEDKIHYKSGVYEGQLKITKELSDLAPLLKDINKWTSFASMTDFKIM